MAELHTYAAKCCRPDHVTRRHPKGSTSSVIDKETAELVEQVTYLANGGTETDYRPARWNEFRETYRYTGKQDDYEVGLVYYGARYFVPGIDRWASPDPLTIHGLGGDMNPYSFVRGSPFRFIDRFGLDEGDPSQGDPIGIAIGGGGAGGGNQGGGATAGRTNGSTLGRPAPPPPPPRPTLVPILNLMGGCQDLGFETACAMAQIAAGNSVSQPWYYQNAGARHGTMGSEVSSGIRTPASR
jgi:RHS repeat-associated protein